MKKGFTLIELLVSALILTIGVTGMLFGFVASRNIIRQSTLKFNATTVGNRMFEEIQRCDNEVTLDSFFLKYYNGSSVQGNYTSIYGEGSSVRKRFYLKFDRSVAVNPSVATDLILITMRVSWDDTYVDGDTENSITMQMVTNEPKPN